MPVLSMRVTMRDAGPMVSAAWCMAVAVVIVMIMRMAVRSVAVAAAFAGIGAAKRVERLRRPRHPGAQAFQHRADDMVAQDQDALGLDRGGEVAVADMPGKAWRDARHRGREFPAIPRRRRRSRRGAHPRAPARRGLRGSVGSGKSTRTRSPWISVITLRLRWRSSCASTAMSNGIGLPVGGDLGGANVFRGSQHGDVLISGASTHAIVSNRRRIHDAW